MAFKCRLRALPAPSPAAPAPAAATQQPHHEEQQYRADRCIDDRTDHSIAQVQTDAGQQPTANERADYPDEKVANDSKTRALHDFAGQPSCNDANEQYDQQAFIRHMHCITSEL